MSDFRLRWPSIRLENLGKAALLLLIAIALLALLSHLPVLHTDLYYFFRPAVRAWLVGESPYGVAGYVSPPWTVLLTLPFALGPLQLGHGLLFLFSCVTLVWTVRTFGGRRWALLGVLTAPPTLSLLALGQIDGWVLIGLLLGRWAVSRRAWAGLGVALALLLVKPQVGGLVALPWLFTLPWRMKGPAVTAAGAIWLVACLAVGVWWPFEVDMLSYFRAPHMDVSTLSAVRGLGLPVPLYVALAVGLLIFWGYEVRRQGATDYTLALSLLVGVLCAPYVARHSLSLTLATAFVLVGRRSGVWAVLCYVLTWLPILGLWVSPWQGWWEAGAWWLLLVALVLVHFCKGIGRR
jgi:hypothetical protein